MIEEIKTIVNITSDCTKGKSERERFQKGSSRRAVSDIIATLLMIAVTVVLAVMLAAYFQGSGMTGIGSSFNSAFLQSQVPPNLKMTGYDTRDGSNLLGTGLNNFWDVNNKELCTKGCEANQDLSPAAGGTEFIVLKIKNEGNDPFTLQDILINDVDHLWDGTGLGATLSNANFPNAGKFRVVSTSDPPVQRTNIISAGEEIRVAIKLSKDIIINRPPPDTNKDIPYDLSLKIKFTGHPNLPTFIVLSGDVT